MTSPFREGGRAGFHYVDGKFVLHSRTTGAIYRSADGLAWTSLRDTTKQKYGSIDKAFYVGGQFHTFPQFPDRGYLTSSDGMLWSEQPLPSSIKCGLKDMTWGDGKFAGISNCSDSLTHNSVTATSVDGKTWTRYDSNVPFTLEHIRYGNGVFVAMNERGPIAVSSDGGKWDVAVSKQTESNFDRNRAMEFGNGMFVLVGDEGRVVTSPDGRTWKDTAALDGRPASLLFAGGHFIVTSTTGGVYRSKDGRAWSKVIKISSEGAALAYGGGRYVAVGAKDLAYSDDSGATWKVQPGRKESLLEGGVHAGGQFIVVGRYGALATSPDGLNWSEPYTGVTTNLSAAAWGNKRAVVVGYGGTILVSSDLVEWTNIINPKWNFMDIAYGGSEFVAVTFDGKIFASSDGEKWDSTYSSPLDTRMRHIGYGNGMFITGSGSSPGTILWSTDGRQWNRTKNDSIRTSLDGSIGYGPAGFFLCEYGGNGDTLYHTTDGRTLQAMKIPALTNQTYNMWIHSIVYSQGNYVVLVGLNNKEFLLYSPDGKNWLLDSKQLYPVRGLISGGGKLLGLAPTYAARAVLFSRFDPVPNPVRPVRRPIASRNGSLLFAYPGFPSGRKAGDGIFSLQGKAVSASTLPQGMFYIRPRDEKGKR